MFYFQPCTTKYQLELLSQSPAFVRNSFEADSQKNILSPAKMHCQTSKSRGFGGFLREVIGNLTIAVKLIL